MNIILGYVGYACSGKDTASKALESLLIKKSTAHDKIEDPTTLVAGTQLLLNNMPLVIWHVPLALAVKIEFVEEQKQIGQAIDLRRLLYDSEYKCQYRKNLIDVGDGRRNTIDPLYWIKKAQNIIQHLLQQHPLKYHIFQITDMRYQNEIPEFENYAYNNGMGMLSVKISTELNTILSRMAKPGLIEYMQVHRLNNSERNVKRIEADINLFNDSTIEDLQEQIISRVLPVLSMIMYSNENILT